MNRNSKVLVGILAVVGAFQTNTADAQYMMHLDPNIYIIASMMGQGGVDPCMTGTAMAESKIAEARAPTRAVIQTYFNAAQGGGPKSAAFHLDKYTKWQGTGVTAGSLNLDRQTDALAVPGNRLDAESLRFYRGGTGATALGQWAVLNARDEVAGVYTALFARSNRVWKLRELTVFTAAETIEPVAQYCRRPGDVMEYRLSSTKSWRENAQKSVEEATAKLANATALEVQAKAAELAKPNDARLATVAREARRRCVYWTKQLEQREKSLTQATEKSAGAQKDADELKRLTGEARNARSFRIAAVQ